MTASILVGDVREMLAQVETGSVQTCVTSPPYFGLRDYGTATWKGGDVSCPHRVPATGSTMNRGNNNHEGAPMGHTCGLCGASRHDSQLGLEPSPDAYVLELVRVFEDVRRVLADDGTLWLNLGDSYAGGHVDGAGAVDGLKPKDLVGIPWRVAFALQSAGWYLRSDIIWHKPNPMPESVTDRPTKAHEYVFLLAKSARYYYNAEAIAEASIDPESMRGRGPRAADKFAQHDPGGFARTRAGFTKLTGAVYETRNRRSVWTVTSSPFADAHFAVMPQALVEPCILAGSRPGDLVLDPFAGAGTVGVVALRHGRRFVGVELNPAYAEMARRRIHGPLLSGWDRAI